MTQKAGHIDLKQSSIVPPESTAGLGRIYTLTDDIMYAEINGSTPFPIAFRLVSENGEDYSQGDLTSTPPGWDIGSGADAVTVADGYFNIATTTSPGTTTSFAYDKQLAVPFVAASENDGRYEVLVGPIIFRSVMSASDEDYYIALHPDNSGSPDTAKYVRLHIQWDTSAGIWQCRGQTHDGTTGTDGAWNTISFPTPPLFAKLVLKRHSGAMTGGVVAVSVARDIRAGDWIQDQALVFTPGTPWLRLSAANLPTTSNRVMRVGAFDVFTSGNVGF